MSDSTHEDLTASDSGQLQARKPLSGFEDLSLDDASFATELFYTDKNASAATGASVPKDETPKQAPNTVAGAGPSLIDRRQEKRGKARRPLPTVEGYEIVEVLGKGAMGIVYKAQQKGLKRLVALKMISTGSHADDIELIRFRTEAEAVARLHHRNIVQVHEIGEWVPETGSEPLPYLSLEYVNGGSLADFLKNTPQQPRLAAELIRDLANAIQYAHDHNVIHRDLKPSNILIDRGDEESTAVIGGSQSQIVSGSTVYQDRSTVRDKVHLNPKIADFGLAKQLDVESNQTMSGAIIGTPSYMAPEQAYGKASTIGPAVDVYSLGAILYEMLTGRPPFKGSSVMETLEQVRRQEPVPPSQLQAKTPIDLETICLKCLQKDISKRYASALELSQDLGRFLDDKPILARPVGHLEQVHRWCRRNPFPALLIGGIAITLIIGTVISTYFGLRAIAGEREAIKNENIAIERKEESERRTYVAEFVLAWQKSLNGRSQEAKQLLEGLLPQRAGDPDLRGFEWHYLQRLCELQLQTFTDTVSDVNETRNILAIATSPDQRWLATAGSKVLIWDRVTGKVIHELQGCRGTTLCVAFSPDGKKIAAGGEDKAIHLWDVITGQHLDKLEAHEKPVRCIAFNPVRSELASGAFDGKLLIWNLDNRTIQIEFANYLPRRAGLAFEKGGTHLYATCTNTSPDGESYSLVRIDINTHEITPIDLASMDVTEFVAISEDGKKLVSYANKPNRRLKIWDVSNVKSALVGSFDMQFENVRSLALSPDGRNVAFGCGDSFIHIWNIETRSESLRIRGNAASVEAVHYSFDGWQILSASNDGHLFIWDANNALDRRVYFGTPGTLDGSLSTDGSCLAALANDGTITVYETFGIRTAKKIGPLSESSKPTSMRFLPNSRQLVVGAEDGSVMTIDTTTGLQTNLCKLEESVTRVAVSPNRKWIALNAEHKSLKIFDLKENSTIASYNLRYKQDDTCHFTFHPNRPWLAISYDKNPNVEIWDFNSGETILSRTDFPGFATAFSPDGKYFVYGTKQAVFDLSSMRFVRNMSKQTSEPITANFDSSGKRFMRGGSSLLVELMDFATGSELLSFGGHSQSVLDVEMSLDRKTMVSLGQDGIVQIWDARPLTPELMIQRQASSLAEYLASQKLDKEKRMQLIQRHPLITNEVRQEAERLSNELD
jgi:eukaryotic-like serine/threonine-protein kinase